MTAHPDEAFLAERERLANAATPRPWAYDDGVDVCMGSPPYQEKNRPAGVFKPSGPSVFTDDTVSDADAEHIVDAHNHQPALIAEIRRLREVCAALMVFMPDGVADIDVHERASELAEVAGREEAIVEDYENAIVQVVREADREMGDDE